MLPSTSTTGKANKNKINITLPCISSMHVILVFHAAKNSFSQFPDSCQGDHHSLGSIRELEKQETSPSISTLEITM